MAFNAVKELAREVRRALGYNVQSDTLDELLNVDEDEQRGNEKDDDYKARQDRVKERKERLGVSSVGATTDKLSEKKDGK